MFLSTQGNGRKILNKAKCIYFLITSLKKLFKNKLTNKCNIQSSKTLYNIVIEDH